MAQEATDNQDPAFQDLYIPRKEGDSTGSSKLVNSLAGGLEGESTEIVEAQSGPLGVSAVNPIALCSATRNPAEPNTAGISQGVGPGHTKQRPAGNLDAYVAGLIETFGRDTSLIDLFEHKNATHMIEKTRKNIR